MSDGMFLFLLLCVVGTVACFIWADIKKDKETRRINEERCECLDLLDRVSGKYVVMEPPWKDPVEMTLEELREVVLCFDTEAEGQECIAELRRARDTPAGWRPPC